MSHPQSQPGPTRPPKPTEQALIDNLPDLAGQDVLCTSIGDAQAAIAAARQYASASVHCSFLDAYRLHLTTEHTESLPSNLTLACEADFPDRTFNTAFLPLSATGEAELVRDQIQMAHQRLTIRGKLFAATDNPKDTWLEQQLRAVFRKIKRLSWGQTVLYIATKEADLNRVRNFRCEFQFRHQNRLIKIVSRPGVFAHRRVDAGARRLMESVTIEPGLRILDIGCGSGTVALALASQVINSQTRSDTTQIVAIDSHARAIECCLTNAALNGFQQIQANLDPLGETLEPGTFDLALANPPYYADFRIAQHFLDVAYRSLRVGGEAFLVTKHINWFLNNMPRQFDNVQSYEEKGYHIVSGRR